MIVNASFISADDHFVLAQDTKEKYEDKKRKLTLDSMKKKNN